MTDKHLGPLIGVIGVLCASIYSVIAFVDHRAAVVPSIAAAPLWMVLGYAAFQWTLSLPKGAAARGFPHRRRRLIEIGSMGIGLVAYRMLNATVLVVLVWGGAGVLIRFGRAIYREVREEPALGQQEANARRDR